MKLPTYVVATAWNSAGEGGGEGEEGGEEGGRRGSDWLCYKLEILCLELQLDIHTVQG